MEEKMKRGVHLIARVIDLKNTRGCPFLFSQRAFTPPGKQKGNRCRSNWGCFEGHEERPGTVS